MSDSSKHIDDAAVAAGVELIKRANRTIDQRKYSGRVGGDWFLKSEFVDREPTPTYHGIEGKAVLYATDDGKAYAVHTYTYGGAELHAPIVRKGLDAAFRVGQRLADGGK